jgi:cation:H+ antiporter
MTPAVLILFVVGLGSLVLGAELLVRGASRLAAAVGVSPLVIGLTIVAYGTSAPELAVSVKAGLAGRADIAVGNVVGSNIFNVLFILGVSALIAPLVVSQQLVRWDVPIMIGTSALALPLSGDGRVGFIDGLILVIGIVVYTTLLIRLARREKSRLVIDEYAREYSVKAKVPPERKARHVCFCLVGLLALVLGTRWFIDGAVALAAAMGVSELVIGLTLVAAGTSLPEVFTSVIATVRGERDIAVGNVVGSNIFNILGILGGILPRHAGRPEGVRASALGRCADHDRRSFRMPARLLHRL